MKHLVLLMAGAWMAAPVIAQQGVATIPELRQGLQTMFGCITPAGAALVRTTIPPEVAARQVLARCAAEVSAYNNGVDAYFSRSPIPQAERARLYAREVALRNGLEARIAAAIRAGRGGANATARPVAPAAPAYVAPSVRPSAGLPPPPLAVTQAAGAVDRCIGRTAAAVPPTITPEAGARQALAGCATERTAFLTQHQGWLNGLTTHSTTERVLARQAMEARVARLEGQVAAAVRTTRNNSGPAPRVVAPPPPRVVGPAPRPMGAVPASCMPAILYFGFGEATLTDRARQSLAAFAQIVGGRSSTEVVSVAAHDDMEPSPGASAGLSQRRGDVVKAALIAAGVPAQRITVQAYGSRRPLIEVARGTREPDNRRVELTCGTGSGW